MIKPTIGRVVWYHPNKGVTLAAIIAYVHSDVMVNLAVFDVNGVAYNQTSVFLYQNEPAQERPIEGFCEWMPYQIGQAAKTAEAEAKIK